MGAQHRRYGGDALVDHLPQPFRKGPSATESVDRRSARARVYPHPLAAGDARPSGGQTVIPSANGMRRFRNNKENIIQLPIAMMNSTCCPGSVTCLAPAAQAASEMELPARHSSVAVRIALSASVNRSEFRQSRTARISSGGMPAVVATRQWFVHSYPAPLAQAIRM